MVAFITSPIDTLLQGVTRACAPSRTCTVVALQPFKPNPLCNLRETNLTPDTRLGSRSRDPIGYVDGPHIFQYLASSPLYNVDPSGNVAQIAVLAVAPLGCYACLTYFYSIGVICVNREPNGQFDSSRVANCMLHELSQLPWYQKASMTVACGTCAWGTARLIQYTIGKIRPQQPTQPPPPDYVDKWLENVRATVRPDVSGPPVNLNPNNPWPGGGGNL